MIVEVNVLTYEEASLLIGLKFDPVNTLCFKNSYVSTLVFCGRILTKKYLVCGRQPCIKLCGKLLTRPSFCDSIIKLKSKRRDVRVV